LRCIWTPNYGTIGYRYDAGAAMVEQSPAGMEPSRFLARSDFFRLGHLSKPAHLYLDAAGKDGFCSFTFLVKVYASTI